MTALATAHRHALPTADKPLPMLAARPSYQLLTRPLEEGIQAARDPSVLKEVEALREDIICSLSPATPHDAIMEIEALATHHPMQPRDDAANAIWARDWLADLADVPLDILTAACGEWRRNASPWMPKPGQLLALINPILSHRKALKRRCTAIIAEREQNKRAPSGDAPTRPEKQAGIQTGLADLASALRTTPEEKTP